MKTACNFPLTIALAVTLLTIVSSCEKDTLIPDVEFITDRTPEAPMYAATQLESAVYSQTAKPFGKSYMEWTKEWWRHFLSQPCDKLSTDVPGQGEHTVQRGPVIFLKGTAGRSGTQKITITKNNAILVPLVNVIMDYPCPNAQYVPAYGQSLYSYLAKQAKVNIDNRKILEFSLNGNRLVRPQEFRVATDLFRFMANPDFINCSDICLTGGPQDAVSDGYWVMLKRLTPGLHKLHIRAESTDGSIVDVTYEINVL